VVEEAAPARALTPAPGGDAAAEVEAAVEAAVEAWAYTGPLFSST